MPNLKTLAKDTAIYGLSSIVARFFNYLLVPLHTAKIPAESGDYGIVSNLYAWAALLFVLLTFGMETTFFRFVNKEGENGKMVYSTALRLVGSVGILFVIAVFIFLGPIASYLDAGSMVYVTHPEYIACFAIIGALDAFQAIMFGQLRQQHRPMKFMTLKTLYIVLFVICNLIIFLVLPLFFNRFPTVEEFYNYYNHGAGLIFFANLICTFLVTFGFLKELKGITFGFDWKLARRMLSYAWPILLLGIVGILGQTFDKIAFTRLVPGTEGMKQLGIYGACAKIAMIMTLLTQAFRYAYEPFVFSKHKDRNSVEAYADAMKYYVIFSYLILLAVTFYLDIFKYIIGRAYWEGLSIVPIVLCTYVFQGVYFNLSFWYKLTDETRWGAYFSLIGLVITLVLQIVFVPMIGYWASCGSSLICYFVIMIISYYVGQKRMPIPYDMKSIGNYTLLTMTLWGSFFWAKDMLADNAHATLYSMLIGTVLLAIYLVTMVRKDFPLSALPVVGKYFKK